MTASSMRRQNTLRGMFGDGVQGSHDKPHWKAGKIKTDEGQIRYNNFQRPENRKQKIKSRI